MGLEIIGAGFGRTGTVSMKAALEILGFGPCYHMREILKSRPGFNDGHLELWSEHAHALRTVGRHRSSGMHSSPAIPRAWTIRRVSITKS